MFVFSFMKTYMVCTNTWEWKVLTNIVPWPLSTYKYERDIYVSPNAQKRQK